MNVVVSNSITPAFTAIGPLCQNATAPLLPATSTNGISGTWNPATINTAVAGTVAYTFTPATGQCAVPFTMNITVTAAVPGIRYTAVTALPNTALPLTARNIGTNYLWTPATGLSSNSVINPVFNFNLTVQYTIQIRSAAGCVTVDTLLVRVPAALPPTNIDILVPRAWSPNGDGRNDQLSVFLVNMRELKYFRIFNRWGQLVFETNSNGQGWNGFFKGQAQPADTYQWIAEGVGNDGKIIKRAGNSVLIR
jgi:gliding motility-associated-like protein